MLVLTGLLLAACSSGGGGSGAQTRDGGGAAQPGQKLELTIMITDPTSERNRKIEEDLLEHFKDKYNITAKPWEQQVAEKSIKTSIVANTPVDLAYYWPNFMSTFVDSDMALDLTPYLDENNGEFRSRFLPGTLEVGTYNGKVYALPSESVYPMILINKDILDQAGVVWPEEPVHWNDFLKVCGEIQAKTDAWCFGINKDWATWFPRNNLLSNWPDEAAMLEFAQGKISFDDERVIEAFEASKFMFENYVYPGVGALSTTREQVEIAFKEGKIAMMANVNSQASLTVKNSGLKNVIVASWPVMNLRYLAGAATGYFIPANAKHPEASIDLLKYLMSPESMQIRVDLGTPVTIKGVTSTDPQFQDYSKDAGYIAPAEIINVDPKIFDIMLNKMPANYVFNGQSSLEELDTIRLEALKNKES